MNELTDESIANAYFSATGRLLLPEESRLACSFARAAIQADREMRQAEQDHDWSDAHQPAVQPAVGSETLAVWEQGHKRYEAARKLNPPQWSKLHSRNLAGEDFDRMIDLLIPATQGAI